MGRGFYLMEPRVARLLLALAVLAACLLAPAPLTKAAVACVVAFATSLRVGPGAARAAPTPAAGAY